MSDDVNDAAELNAQLEVVKPRPWVRYWARMFDIYIFSLIVGVFLGLTYPEALETSNDLLLGVVFMFVWVFVESILLTVAGTTPGKALLKVKLIKPDGNEIRFNEALSRSFRVWWRGMGVGIPLVALFTMTNAYNNLKINGVSSWDKDGAFFVSHEKIGWVRVLVAIVFFIMFLGLIVLGSAEGA
ncbi:MAG: RDD family protein [Pseudomonadales bacterium]|nr:RDD family protein [Pseudomonadales bacterium]